MKYYRFLALTLFTLTCLPADTFAQDNDIQARPLQVSRRGDLELSCNELSMEAALMRDIIFATQDIRDDSRLESNGIKAAGAVGSLLVGTMTAGVGLAAAGFLASQHTEDKDEDADKVQDMAEQRRAFMIGIYNAKGCMGPTEHVMVNPDPQGMLDRLGGVEPAAGEQDAPSTTTKAKPRFNQ